MSVQLRKIVFVNVVSDLFLVDEGGTREVTILDPSHIMFFLNWPTLIAA